MKLQGVVGEGNGGVCITGTQVELYLKRAMMHAVGEYLLHT